MITIAGLGPGDPELITRRAWKTLTAAPEIWVRTRQHPAVPALAEHTQVHSYDHLYEQHHDFAEVYAAIAADVIARAIHGPVIYAVPGDPTVAEATTIAIRALAAERRIPCTIESAVSFLEPSFAAVEADPILGIQVLDAIALAEAHHPPGSPQQGLLVAQLYSRFLAGEVKLTLLNAYPHHHPVALIAGAGSAAVRVRHMQLYELDRQDGFDDMTTLWVPPLPRAGGYNALQEIVAHLRAPYGCPWDREQTHESLRPYLLEEAYEVLEALDGGDPQELCEELGDLLLQVALHVQIATEEGTFMLADVIEHIVSKLIRRHPHVFTDLDVADVAEVTRNWESIKQAERRQNGQADAPKKSLLDGLPRALPALTLAQGYIERLTRVGYPLAAYAPLSEPELGGELLQLVERAQAAGLNAETAMRQMCAALRLRLQKVEAEVEKCGASLLDLEPEQQKVLWEGKSVGW